MNENSESGVSPVVGVMLMLVVTIIIAALVSAFAGGAIGETSKAPQATVDATYSISKGMTISHNGGDAIPLSTTTLYVRPTKSFGADADKYSWEVNKSYIRSGDDIWARGAYEGNITKAFLAGDTFRIAAEDLKFVQERPDGTVTDYTDYNVGFSNQANVGLSFTLEVTDSGGKTISQSLVTIGA